MDVVLVFSWWVRIFYGVMVVEDWLYDGVWLFWYVMLEKLIEMLWFVEKVIELEIMEY